MASDVTVPSPTDNDGIGIVNRIGGNEEISSRPSKFMSTDAAGVLRPRRWNERCRDRGKSPCRY